MTTALSDNDKQVSVYSDIRSLCVCELISLDQKGRVVSVSVTPLLEKESKTRVVYLQRQQSHFYTKLAHVCGYFKTRVNQLKIGDWLSIASSPVCLSDFSFCLVVFDFVNAPENREQLKAA